MLVRNARSLASAPLVFGPFEVSRTVGLQKPGFQQRRHFALKTIGRPCDSPGIAPSPPRAFTPSHRDSRCYANTCGAFCAWH